MNQRLAFAAPSDDIPVRLACVESRFTRVCAYEVGSLHVPAGCQDLNAGASAQIVLRTRRSPTADHRPAHDDMQGTGPDPAPIASTSPAAVPVPCRGSTPAARTRPLLTMTWRRGGSGPEAAVSEEFLIRFAYVNSRFTPARASEINALRVPDTCQDLS